MAPPKRTSSKPGDDSVSFPVLHSLNPVTNVATIAAEFEGNRVLCRVKIDDLRSKYGSSPGDPMQLVANNRDELEKAARQLIESRHFESDGSVMIAYEDL